MTADQALKHKVRPARPPAEFLINCGTLQWLTTHAASSEVDIGSGLRENFDPKKRWKSAIASARALSRFQNIGGLKRTSTSLSTASGGWAGEEAPFEVQQAPSSDTDSLRDFVDVQSPALEDHFTGTGDEPITPGYPTTPLNSPAQPKTRQDPSVTSVLGLKPDPVAGTSGAQSKPTPRASEDLSYNMPGALHWKAPEHEPTSPGRSWMEMFRGLHLK